MTVRNHKQTLVPELTMRVDSARPGYRVLLPPLLLICFDTWDKPYHLSVPEFLTL